MGVTLASFHSWGIMPVKIVRFMRYAIGLAISGAASFRTLAGISSRPVAFDNFSLHSSCLTNVGLTSRSTLGVSTLGVGVWVDCEQSLSFPRVARVAISEGRTRAAKPREAAFPPRHSLLVSFPNLHNINSSTRRGFQEQKPTTRSLGCEKNVYINYWQWL